MTVQKAFGRPEVTHHLWICVLKPEKWSSAASPSFESTPYCLSCTYCQWCAVQQLDTCPAEVIRRFINRSWRFMSAYRMGLTGKAAEWAVKKQKGHCQVSCSTMMSIEAVLDTVS